MDCSPMANLDPLDRDAMVALILVHQTDLVGDPGATRPIGSLL
jgi:hypothetical protein